MTIIDGSNRESAGTRNNGFRVIGYFAYAKSCGELSPIICTDHSKYNQLLSRYVYIITIFYPTIYKVTFSTTAHIDIIRAFDIRAPLCYLVCLPLQSAGSSYVITTITVAANGARRNNGLRPDRALHIGDFSFTCSL